MRKMLHYKREFARWQHCYDAAAPRIGNIAPDFELRDTVGENPVRLSDYRGKLPVALIFGSFT